MCFAAAFYELWLGVDGLAKDVIAFDSKLCSEVFKLLFSGLSLLAALDALFARLRILIVSADGFDDKTATIFHICGME